MTEPTLDRWTTLFLFAAVQGVFLAVLLFLHQKGNRNANRTLATIVLFFSVMLLYYVSYWSGYATKYRWLNGWTEPLVFLFGPLTWFYLQVLENGNRGKRYILHLIPAVLQFLFNVPLILRNIFGRIEWLRSHYFSHGPWIDTSVIVFLVLQNLSVIGYAIAMHQFLRADYLRLNRFATDEEKQKHSWLKKVVWFYSGFAIAFCSYYLLAWSGLLKLEYDYLISVAMSVFIYMVGYLGFRQPEIFHGYILTNGKKADPKYARSSLREEQAKTYLEKLLEVMNTEKPYLDSELKIQQLADKVGVSSHHLSQIINEQLNQRYADFINTYRINEAKKLLLSPSYEQEKILSIAFDSGFHNKATFNATFKKQTGMSPTEFRKYHQKVLVN